MPTRPVHTQRRDLLSILLHNLDGQTVVVRPHGELDPLRAPLLEQVLDHQLDHHSRVVLDLGAVWYLGSRGLRVLEQAQQRARQLGTRFEVIAPPDHIAHRLAGLVGSEVTIGSAVNSLGQNGRLPEPRTPRSSS